MNLPQLPSSFPYPNQQPSLYPGLQFYNEVNLDYAQSQLNHLLNLRLLQSVIEERIRIEMLASQLANAQRGQLPIDRHPIQNATFLMKNGSTSNSQNESPKLKEESSESSFSAASSRPRSGVMKLRKRVKAPMHISPPMKSDKNQTKNIPKNFGKAIACFIEHNEPLVRRVFTLFPQLDYSEFLLDMKRRRRSVNSIAALRSFWIEEENIFAAPTRILSQIFLRKHCFHYIFSSRVTYFEGHIKYRVRLLEALENPKDFNSFKCY